MTDVTKDQERFLSYVQKDDNGCWRWCGSKAITGYGNFFLNRTVWLAHRASLVLFGGVKQLTPGLQVSHSCGNRDCVAPEHLSEKTASENNNEDKKKHGKDLSGDKCHFSKLNWAKVSEIRSSSAQHKKPKQLAETYGVSQSCISSILRGRTWRE